LGLPKPNLKGFVMRLIAELTMPNVGSWNGQYSGAKDRKTVVFATSSKKYESLIGSYYYNFGDGWGASVQVREAEPRERVTKKFSGYEWMLAEIKVHGKILTSDERDKLKEESKNAKEMLGKLDSIESL
jgi:hypothetical protein